MLETVLLILFLLCLNLLLAIRPIPIMAFPVGIATFGIFATEVLNDSGLPYQPFLTMLFLLIVVCCLIVNAYEVKN